MTVIVGDMNVKMDWKILIFFVLSFVLISGCTSVQNLPTGTLHLTSSPSGAEVYLDTQFRGSTPSTMSGVALGNHVLEYRYPGYESWSDTITVSSGTSQYYAALLPLPGNERPPDKSSQATTIPTISQTQVTVRVNKNPMIIGESNLFSGTCFGSDSVELKMYGPGYYSQGVVLTQVRPDAMGTWVYTWNPGSSLLSGYYTMEASDKEKTTSDSVVFSVIGGGVVSVTSSTFSAAKGETVTFSGQCTSGAQNVMLVLFGPGQYAGGVTLGTFPVLADRSWNFKMALDSTMPTGVYTMYVYDVPKTSSGNVQFTVGFAS
jgi:hypothetical protein